MSKVAIVTGGIKGIGLGIGKAFLEQGYQVVLDSLARKRGIRR